jgi:competence protein ComEC
MLYLDILATSDFSLIYLPNAPTWALGFAMMGSFLVLMPRGMVGKWISIAWFLPALFPHLEKPKEGEIYFDLLDVGQGLSAVIQTKNHVLIYDTAPAFEQKVIAESTLIPFLRGKGIQDISRLVISHPHADHAGGVKSLMQAFEINDILTTEPKRWTNASYCKNGQFWEWDGVTFEMLAGEENYYYNNSCVLKITTGKHSILLTGDIERDQELKLAYERNIKANILIAPHHGSKTSSTHTFVNAVQPDYALFSVGYKNQFKHPRPEIIQRYQSVGTQTLETQNSGMISFQITPEMISPPQRYREIHRHYWHR